MKVRFGPYTSRVCANILNEVLDWLFKWVQIWKGTDAGVGYLLEIPNGIWNQKQVVKPKRNSKTYILN